MFKSLLLTLVFFLSIFIVSLSFPQNSYALSCSITGSVFNTGDKTTIDASGFLPQYSDQPYTIRLQGTSSNVDGQTFPIVTEFIPNQTPFPKTIDIPLVPTGKYHVDILLVPIIGTGDSRTCARNISITNTGSGVQPTGPTCSFSPTTVAQDDKIEVTGSNFPRSVEVRIMAESKRLGSAPTTSAGTFKREVKVNTGIGRVLIKIVDKNNALLADCGFLEVIKKGSAPKPGLAPGKNPCIGDECETAIGKIPTTIQGFAGHILTLAIGLAGGLALILMVIGSVRVLTSSGDQQKLAAGRDMIVAAVAGLLFLIFSVLILKFIGVQILGLG